MFAAFPPRDLWFLAPVSLGILYAVLRVGRPRIRVGALTGLVYGLVFFVPLLPWIGEYVGPLPWLALAVIMALYLAAFGAVATVTMRLRWAPLWFAIAWTGVEAVRSSFPFGGFPWGRAAFSQTSGLVLPTASVVGVPGLSFLVALVGAGAASLVLAAVAARTGSWSWRRAAAAAAALIVPLIAGSVLLGTGAPGTHSTSTLEVAAVQGNVPRLGLDFNAQRRAVLDNHVNETMELARQVQRGERRRPDLVLWPENASDIPPLQNEDAAAEIRTAVTIAGVPITVGTLMPNPDGPTNSVLLWGLTDGVADQMPSDRYDKHIIQPFGEYLPWRDFFRHFSSYADRAGNFQAGTGPAILTADTPNGQVRVGVSTCWEVAFDRSPRQAVNDGAQFLYVPTNNATFGLTDMSSQQLAMSRVRAVETGRSVAVVSTSGLSALIRPDGSIITESGLFEPAILESPLDLRDGTTPAVWLGAWPERVALLALLAGFLYALCTTTSLEMFAGGSRLRSISGGRNRLADEDSGRHDTAARPDEGAR
ncbi:apolipoprotein N-acyltransferase [Gordonia sp. HY366]|uniref:Apolipoprotein N-acyltransferase n=2 Tax=Gordonia liuliyuniae TaxID=2911517 RepID=A0ABS9IQR3_9ACTN|nr:apolipoprotein N-acyltransferase [Gordonia liuliyuniae]MCF8587882.1 apolipoprotein N-acyltransferase [Gordonia liuliyuniae]